MIRRIVELRDVGPGWWRMDLAAPEWPLANTLIMDHMANEHAEIRPVAYECITAFLDMTHDAIDEAYPWTRFMLAVDMHNAVYGDWDWRNGCINENHLPVSTRVEYAQ